MKNQELLQRMQQWFGVVLSFKTKVLALQLLLISKCSNGATLA